MLAQGGQLLLAKVLGMTLYSSAAVLSQTGLSSAQGRPGGVSDCVLVPGCVAGSVFSAPTALRPQKPCPTYDAGKPAGLQFAAWATPSSSAAVSGAAHRGSEGCKLVVMQWHQAPKARITMCQLGVGTCSAAKERPHAGAADQQRYTFVEQLSTWPKEAKRLKQLLAEKMPGALAVQTPLPCDGFSGQYGIM